MQWPVRVSHQWRNDQVRLPIAVNVHGRRIGGWRLVDLLRPTSALSQVAGYCMDSETSEVLSSRSTTANMLCLTLTNEGKNLSSDTQLVLCMYQSTHFYYFLTRLACRTRFSITPSKASFSLTNPSRRFNQYSNTSLVRVVKSSNSLT